MSLLHRAEELFLKESEQKLVKNKKTAALVLSAILTTVMLTACSEEEAVDYTEAENALQASLVGYWTDDMELFEKTVAEENASVSVLEFTEDYKYLWHECDFAEWQIKTYEPTEYSFEELMLKIDNNGEEAFAKLELSSDGGTLYWITDEHTYDYTRVSEDIIRKIGVPEQEPENPETDVDNVAADGQNTEAADKKDDIELDGNTSPSGYVLDPTYKLEGDINQIDYENYAVLIKESEGAMLYGVYPGGREPLIIIEHDGIIDEFEQDWLTPRQVLPEWEWLDADGDGEDELAVSYYVGSGTGISVEELVVYKKGSDGHFTEHRLDAEELVDEYVNFFIENDSGWIDFAAYGTEETYSTSTAKAYPDGIESIGFGSIVSYKLEDGKIEMHTMPSAHPLRYECMPEIVARVKFDGEDFDLEYIDFRKAE